MKFCYYKLLLNVAGALLLVGCASLPSGSIIRKKSASLDGDPAIRRFSTTLSDSESRQLLASAIPDYTRRTLLHQHMRFEDSLFTRPIVAGNRVELLVDGPQAYPAMFDAIKAARHHVHLETFILAADSVGNVLKDILLELLGKGVEVRIIYDSYGSFSTPNSFFHELKDAGAQVHKYHPLNPIESLAFWKVMHRDHRKLLIVDGRVGFAGGMNISDVYSRSSFTRPLKPRDVENRWRDTHLQLDGPVVADIQTLFLETWTKVNGEQMAAFEAPEYYPVLSKAGEQFVRIISSEGGDDKYEIYEVLLSAVTHAEERIWITQGYFAPNGHFTEALMNAAGRGVDVRLLLPGFTDSWITLNASRAQYTELLETGVKLFRRMDALLHAKSAIVDGVWSTVGSANLDSLSFIHNNEANAVIYGREFGTRLEELFLFDQDHTDPITLEEWRKRPILNKIMERIAVLFNYWL